MGKLFTATAIDILPALWDRYGGYLRREITNVRIVHKFYRCYLEITTTVERPHEMDERVERIDLTAVSADADDPLFPGHVSAFVTARKFVEDFNEYDLIMCTTLFTEQAASFIEASHRTVSASDTEPVAAVGGGGM